MNLETVYLLAPAVFLAFSAIMILFMVAGIFDKNSTMKERFTATLAVVPIASMILVVGFVVYQTAA